MKNPNATPSKYVENHEVQACLFLFAKKNNFVRSSMWAVIFLLELFGLFFLSQAVTRMFFLILLRVIRHERLAVILFAFLFLPGVMIHELSHYVAAKILFVPVGRIEFFPQLYGSSVTLGSVTIKRTDIFRRFVIGIAPLISGLLLLSFLFWFYYSPFFSVSIGWKNSLFVYSTSEITATMFSSKKDVEGSMLLLPVIGVAVFFMQRELSLLQFLMPFLYRGSLLLFFALLVNGTLYFIEKLFLHH